MDKIRAMHKILGKDRLFMLFILLIGAILRLWNYLQIPYMHDELSALSRLQFDGLSNIIKYGVMIGDTHPAGVQVFMYLWTAVGGTSEEWVKLPFVVFGILSIWIAFKIGRLLFDNVSGLLTAVMIASTQFFIMYSQLARPYSSGLLLTLLMTYFWCAYFFGNRKNINLLWFVVFAALSSYNHHFSLLFAAIVGISGVFLINSRKQLITYAISGLTIFVLYIPHLEIFFAQLGKGGIGGEGGWLSAPEPLFLFDYLNYMLHFSIWSWLSIVVVVILLQVYGKSFASFSERGKKRVILVIWFILPALIGYFYSVWVNPVIQYSLLLFSTPYIYMVIFSFHRKVTTGKITMLISLLLLVNILTLVLERKHYQIFYFQPYEELFKTAILENDDNDVYIINDCIPYYNEYYFEKYGMEVPYTTKRNTGITRAGFVKTIKAIEQHTIVAHAIDEEEYRIIKESFPYIADVKKGFTYEIITFSKDTSMRFIDYDKSIAYTDFNKYIGNWKNVRAGINADTIENTNYLQLDRSVQWGPSVTFTLSDIANDVHGIIDAVVECEPTETVSKLLLVVSVMDGDKVVFWNSSDITDYSPQLNSRINLHIGIDLQTALQGYNSLNGLDLRFNIWNKDGLELKIYSFEVFARPGNPIRYSLYNKLL